ncbi:MAG: bacillithiol biosynthesis cysteine-adding enzyme BshC [Terriglobales bacterium]
MNSECLPFLRIPHTSRLFSDFLYDFSRVRQFYARAPFETASHPSTPNSAPAWLADESRRIAYDSARRARVADILARQNRAFGCGDATLASISRLRNGASAAVTGQQVGLFAGPLFSVLKAITAVRIAAEATRAGADCVPVFWLATEDHDLAEVNHATLLTSSGELQTLVTSPESAPNAPIRDVRLGADIETLVAAVAEQLGPTEAAGWLAETYRPGATLGAAFAGLFARMFRDWGVILLDASDPELHAVASPLYRDTIRRSASLGQALLARGKVLTDAGYHEQVKVTASSTLLFAVEDGARTPIHRAAASPTSAGDGGYTIGKRKISEAELLARIEAGPQNFSPNVLLRPVVQDYLLPTLAYTGGPSEVAYFAQVAVVYEQLLGRVTPVLPRFSATIIEPHVRRLIERYQLKLTDVFEGQDHLRSRLAARTLPAELRAAFDSAGKSLESSEQSVQAALTKLDPTLVKAAERAAAKMRYQLNRLRTRAASAELHRNEILTRHAQQLSAALCPGHNLQERMIAGIYFISRYGPSLLQSLYDSAQLTCPDHQVLYV